MKRNSQLPLWRLVVTIVCFLTNTTASAQTVDAKLPYINMDIDPGSGPGGAYIATYPTATSGAKFSANLTWLADDQMAPVNEVAVSNRSFEGGYLSSFSFTSSDSYSGGGGNSFTGYVNNYSGGSPTLAYKNQNDVSALIAGFGLAWPLDNKRSWSWG